MTNVVIGKNVENGEEVHLDLEKLMEGGAGMLANSGGGKSHLIKQICEATHVDTMGQDALQQIIMDWEGDLVTLAEKFDYLVAQKDAKIPVDPRSAEMLAKRVLELNANIIVDMSDLDPLQRREFAKNFIFGLIHTPKELWNRQCMVVIDEAHELAPEKGYGESVALPAVVALMSQGRKRGLRGILASQRPARLAKDAVSQTRNKFIGLCSWDIDKKAVVKEMGFSKEQEESLGDLDHEFYVRGPAISKTLIKMKAGPVKSRELKAGKIADFKPAQSAKVSSMLEKLSDLAKDAELDTNDKVALRNEVTRLRRELTIQQGHRHPVNVISEEQKSRLIQQGYEKAKAELRAPYQVALTKLASIYRITGIVRDESAKVALELDNAIKELEGKSTEMFKVKPATLNTSDLPSISSGSPAQALVQRTLTAAPAAEAQPGDSSFGKAERKILKFLAVKEGRTFNKGQIGAMTGYASKGGGFNNAISRLKVAGLIIQVSPDSFCVNVERIQDIIAILGSEYNTPGQDALEQWLGRLGKAPKMLYEVLLKNPTTEFTKDDLAAQTGYTAGGGGFNNAISELCTLSLAERTPTGLIRLNQELLQV